VKDAELGHDDMVDDTERAASVSGGEPENVNPTPLPIG
jgi:hypothetical protein